MTFVVTPKKDNTINSQLVKGGFQKTLDITGRLPPISFVITPLDKNLKTVYLDRFLSYSFSSSMMIPVESFDFTFAAPDSDPFYSRVKEGDIITIFANDQALSTGIIDMVDTETDESFGEKIQITGRNLMSQLEDQDAISIQDTPIFGQKAPVSQVISTLLANTRVNGFRLQNAPVASYLFATEPGESKLTALQRYIEPLNVLPFMDPNGRIVIGRPNMSQKPKSTLYLLRDGRRSNVRSMKAIRAATTIPNIMVPIWTGQENVTDRTPIGQRLLNAAEGPKRLRQHGHNVPKTVVVSTPDASSPQGFSEVNQIQVAGSNILQAYAKRELARQNHKELIVQAVVPGHYNELGEPYRIDTTYKIQYDRALIDEVMYLFQVEFGGDEGGQRTTLFFCRLGTIVSDIKAP